MPQQAYLPDLEPPPDPARDPEIDAALQTKYERLAALKLAKEAVHISDAKLLELVERRGQPYPFLEPGTGRRKTLRLDAAKKLKTVANKSAKREQADREWAEAQKEHRGGEQQDASREQWEAEVARRRAAAVNGADMANEMGLTAEQARARYDSPDPFGATREALSTDDDTVADTPAQRAVKEAEEARAARRSKRGSR